MGKLKNVALAQAPIAVRRQLAIDPTDSAPTKVIRSRPAAPPLVNGTPTKFAYALKPYTCERRPNGWHVCRTPFSAVGGTLRNQDSLTFVIDAKS